MKLDYLIDTNIFISSFNEELIQPIPDGELGYSIITEIELLSYISLSMEEENLIRSGLALLTPIFINRSITDKTINLRRKYGLKMPDAIIPASAWEFDTVLVTNDKQLLNIKEIKTLSMA